MQVRTRRTNTTVAVHNEVDAVHGGEQLQACRRVERSESPSQDSSEAGVLKYIDEANRVRQSHRLQIHSRSRKPVRSAGLVGGRDARHLGDGGHALVDLLDPSLSQGLHAQANRFGFEFGG